MTSLVKIYVNASGSGWGAVIDRDGQKREISGKIDGTRFAALVHAATEGLRLLPTGSQVAVYSDIEYLTMGASQWINCWASHGWYKANGEEVSNRSEWEALLPEICRHEITWQHPEKNEFGLREALCLAQEANQKTILTPKCKKPSSQVQIAAPSLETGKSQPEKPGFPIVPDNGTDRQRENYVKLLQKVAQVYNLIGLPSNLDTLFENYELPKNLPQPTPSFVFLDYPQRPRQDEHDFAAANLSTARVQSGPANVLYNQDFTLTIGRVSSSKPHYGYSALLLRNDKLRVYTMRYTVNGKIYRYGYEAFLSDIEELIILAFHSRKNRMKLEKYVEENPKIVHFLKFGYIEHDSGRYYPVTGFSGNEAKYICRRR